jgi:hypothetical protein
MSDSMKKDLESVFKDLSGEEMQIYELALLRGYITSSMIHNLKINKSAKKIEDHIKKLEQKKILKKLPGIIPRYVPLTPIKDFLNYLNQFESEKKGILKDLQDLPKNQENTAKSLQESTRNSISSSISELKEKLEELRNKSTKSTEVYLKEVEEILQTLTTSVEKKIQEKTETITKSFDKEMDDKSENISQESSDVQSSYIEQSDKTIKNFEDKLKLHTEELNKFFVNQQISIDESLTKTKGLVSEQAERMDEKMEKVSLEAQQVLKENVENSAETIAQAIRNAEDISKNTLDGVIKNSETMLSNASGEVKKIFDNTYSEVQNTEEHLINALGAQQNELKEKIRTQVTDLMGSTTNQMRKVQSDLVNDSDTLVNDSITEFQTSHKEWGDKYNKILTETINSINEGSTQLKSMISKSIQDEITKFKGEVMAELTKIQNEYVKRVEQTGKSYETAFKNNINDKLVNFQNDLKKNLEQVKNENSEFTKNQTAQYTEFNNKLKTSISNTGESISKDFRTILQTGYEEALKSISNIYIENSGQAESSINSTLDILQQNSKLLLLDIDEVAKVIDEGLNIESGKLLTTVDERINKIRELAQQTIENQDTIINENMKKNKQILEILAQNANFSLDKASEAMKETVTKFEMGLKPNISTLLNETKTVINATKQDLNLLVENLKNSYSEYAKNLKEAFSSTMKFTTSEFQNQIQTQQSKTEELVKKVKEKIEEGFQHVTNSSEQMFKEYEEALTSTSETIETEVLNKITELTSDVKTNFLNAANSLELPKQMIKDIWTNFIDSKIFDSEKTWVISGQEVIMEYVSEMISRAKASVFLLVPKFDDLDWNLIMDIHKKGRKFIVCTNLETAKDINLVNKVFESGIELYSYTEKDFIAAYHDNEEVLLAPISLEDDETTAIVSEIPPMVTHMSSMFADYWRRTAKKYTPK